MLHASGRLGVAGGSAEPVFRVLHGHDFRVSGLVVAAIWAVGLAIGVIALVTGHIGAAIAALGVAASGPWLGLAWAAHAQRGPCSVDPSSRD